jgi:hypothetical protein
MRKFNGALIKIFEVPLFTCLLVGRRLDRGVRGKFIRRLNPYSVLRMGGI